MAVTFVASGVGAWAEQSPLGIVGAQVDDIDPVGSGFRDPVVGAVQSLALFDTSSTLRGAYAATVNGGIWKTGNITDPNPLWQPVTD